MAAEVSADLTLIQDEDVLRRMWADTEDFGRKKEIRARMYKLREQRLRDFYTTGEVVTEMTGRKHTTTTHAESIADQGFLSMKSKEIRDSESPTRDFNRRGDNNYWNSVKQSSYTTGEKDGAMVETRMTTQEGEGLRTEGDTQTKTAVVAKKVEEASSKSDENSSSKCERMGQSTRLVSSSVSQDGKATSLSSSQQEQSSQSKVEQSSSGSHSATKWSSSSSSSSSRRVVTSSSQSYQITSGDEQNTRNLKAITSAEDASRIAQENLKENVAKTSTDFKDELRNSSETSSVQKISSSTQNLSSTRDSTMRDEKQSSTKSFLENERTDATKKENESVVIKEADIKLVNYKDETDKVRKTDIETQKSQKTSSVEIRTAEQDSVNVTTDQKILNEIHKLDTFLSTQNTPGASTPASPHSVTDGANWTVVSNTGGEFVYHVDKKTDNNVGTVENRANIVKHPSTLELPKEATDGQYVTTYQQSYKRISVDNSPSHEFFARTLRASPDRSTPSPTKRTSSKGSLDSRGSPERKFRGSSPRKTPEKERRVSAGSYTIERPSSETRRKTSETNRYSSVNTTSKSKRKLSSTQAKTANKTRVATPGASPSTSPTRKQRNTSSTDSDSDSSQLTYNKTTSSISLQKTDASDVEVVDKTTKSKTAIKKTSKTDTEVEDKYATFDRKKKVQDYSRSDTDTTETIETNLRRSSPLVRPTRLSPREKSPEYSSEGSVSRELKGLKSPIKHYPDSSPERGVFEPIKINYESSTITESTDLIDQEKLHITKTSSSVESINSRKTHERSTENMATLKAPSPSKGPKSSSVSPCSSPDRSNKRKSSSPTPDSSPDRTQRKYPDTLVHVVSPVTPTPSPTTFNKQDDNTPHREDVVDRPTKKSSSSSPEREIKKAKSSPRPSPERTPTGTKAVPPSATKHVTKQSPSSSPERAPLKKKSRPSISPERKPSGKVTSPEKKLSSPSTSPERKGRKSSSSPSPDRATPRKPSLPVEARGQPKKHSTPVSSPERSQPKSPAGKTSEGAPSRPLDKPKGASPSSKPKPMSSPESLAKPKESSLPRKSAPMSGPTRQTPEVKQPIKPKPIKQKTTEDILKQKKPIDANKANPFKTNVVTTTTTTTTRVIEKKSPTVTTVSRITRRSSIPRAENKPTPKKSKENIQPKPTVAPSTPTQRRPVSASPAATPSKVETRTVTRVVVQKTVEKPRQVPVRKPTPAISVKPSPQPTRPEDRSKTSRIPIEQKLKAPTTPQKTVPTRKTPVTSLNKFQATNIKRAEQKIITKQKQNVPEEYSSTPEDYETSDFEDIKEIDVLDKVDSRSNTNINENKISLSALCDMDSARRDDFIQQEKYYLVAMNLEDERPPEEFFADIEDENITTTKITEEHTTKTKTHKTDDLTPKRPLADKQKINKPTSKPAAPKSQPLKPETKPLNSQKTTSNKNISSQSTTKTTKVITQKDKFVGKQGTKPSTIKKTPIESSSSSSSSEDEDETLTLKKRAANLETIDITVNVEKENLCSERLTSKDQLSVLVQHPKSSRESSPEKGVPFCTTSDDGESNPRYADFVSEPEDVEVFDKTTGPSAPIRFTDARYEQVTDLDEETDTQIKLDVSVADRVSKFLETTRKQESVSQEPSPVPTGSPASVRKAKAMFENIAKSQVSPPAPTNKKIDLYDVGPEPQKKEPSQTTPKEPLLPKEEIHTVDELDFSIVNKVVEVREIDQSFVESDSIQLEETNYDLDLRPSAPEAPEEFDEPNIEQVPTSSQTKPKPKSQETPSKKPFERKPSGDISSKKAFFEDKAKDGPKEKTAPAKKETPKQKPVSKPVTKEKSPLRETQAKQKVSVKEEARTEITTEESTIQLRTSSRQEERIRQTESPEKVTPKKEKATGKSPRQSPERKMKPESSPDRTPSRKESVERVSPDRAPLKVRDVNVIQKQEDQEHTKVGKFGVTLRRTPSSTSNKLSPTSRKPSLPGEDLEIEEIFQLDLLEEMLLKAVAYDERRRIRAQIRIVKRQMEEANTTTTVTKTTRTTTSAPTTKRSVEKLATRKSSDVHLESSTIETTETVSSVRHSTTKRTDERLSPERVVGRRPESGKAGSPEKTVPRGSSPTKKSRESPEKTITGRTIESVKDIRSRETIEKSPDRKTSRTPRESPEKSPERKPSVPKQSSLKTRESPERRTIESVKTYRSGQETRATRTSVDKSPERKTSRPVRESPERSAFKRTKDSPDRAEPVTNGYHKAETLARATESKVSYEVATSVRSQTTKKTSTSEVRETCPTDSITSSYGVGPTDENGRPLFGLKALRRTNTNKTLTDETDQVQTEESFIAGDEEDKEICDVNGRPLFGLKALQTTDEAMPAQPSAQLKELVEKHQQFVLREKSTTEAPRQKPKAKFRDSFIQADEDVLNTSISSSTDDSPSTKGLLRSLIQKHEDISTTGTGTQTKHEMRSSSTVVKSHISQSSDGKISHTRDVIKGEVSAKNGEEPVGKITRSHYSYQSPEEKDVAPEITSTTTTSILGQRRRSSGPKIFELEDNETLETDKSSRRYSKDYIVDEEDSSTKVTSQMRRGSNTSETSSISRYSQNYEEELRKAEQKKFSTTSVKQTSSSKITEQSEETNGFSDKVTKKVVGSDESSTTKDQIRRKSISEEEKNGTTKKTIVRGDSVRALQHKFQQATVSSTLKQTSHVVTEKSDSKSRANETRTRETKSVSPVVTKQVSSQQHESQVVTSVTKTPLETSETTSKVTKVSQSGTSFLDNNTKVTGVQDILTRMRNANLVVESEDSAEDAEARALLNKFLGASVILQGMEQGMRAAAASAPSSAALVSQAEKQRVMATTTRKQEDVDEISDEKQLRILLEACSDYETRRKIRARLRIIMADQKPCGDEIALRSSDTSGTQREGECLGLPRWKASSSAVDDSGTESGEDLRLLSPEVLREIQSALSRLEGALPGIAPGHRETVSELVNRLQSCLRVNPPSVPPQPPPRRFGNKRSLKNRHTVSVTSEELASARRWISENEMERQTSVGSLNQQESLVAKVFRPVKFTLPVQPALDRSALPNPLNLQKMQVIRKVFCKPMLHRAGYFMEPSPQVAAVSYIEPFVGPPSVERSFSDSGSLVDYDPSLTLFTPEQSVQIAVHKAAINKQISQEGFKRRESSDDGDVSSTEEDVAVVPFSGVSSAQRLLQLASDHPKKSSTPKCIETRQVTTKTDDDSFTKTEVQTRTSTTARLTKANSVQSPFAKFRQLERQNSAPSVGRGAPMYKFTDPKLVRSASTIKERLLNWVQAQTREYKNIQIENFSTCWSNGLAFCALIHHFCPDAFDYDSLSPQKRRYNFELAFRVADEKGGIAPLLDVEDMVTMRKPDWKCVFTYVQSFYRRYHDSPDAVRI